MKGYRLRDSCTKNRHLRVFRCSSEILVREIEIPDLPFEKPLLVIFELANLQLFQTVGMASWSFDHVAQINCH